MEDIYDTGTMLGLALSHDFAARQRVSLVGDILPALKDADSCCWRHNFTTHF